MSTVTKEIHVKCDDPEHNYGGCKGHDLKVVVQTTAGYILFFVDDEVAFGGEYDFFNKALEFLQNFNDTNERW
jgi:hypothetical protein